MTNFAIEFDQGAPEGGYGKVHLADCGDLRDPEPLGADWESGLRSLGTEWQIEVDDGSVRLASCVKPLTAIEKWFPRQKVTLTGGFRSGVAQGVFESAGRVRGGVSKFLKDSGFEAKPSSLSQRVLTEGL